MDVDILIYIAGSILVACVSAGFVFWAIKSGQFQEDDKVKQQPLEEDDEIDS